MSSPPARVSTRRDLLERLGPVRQAPVLLSMVVALLVALALFGTGIGSSEASPSSTAMSTGHLATGVLETAAPPASGSSPPASDVEAVDAVAQADGAAATAVFATAGGLQLHLPSHHVVLTGFHQASTPGSLAMNPTDVAHRVLPSRGRPYPRTSAVDIVMLDDDRVRSPVSGRVEKVEGYALYGKYPDRRVTLVPDDAPNLRVVVLHVAAVQVEAGDRVVAGETDIAKRARKFPFRSQIDKKTAPDRFGHVHYEVKER